MTIINIEKKLLSLNRYASLPAKKHNNTWNSSKSSSNQGPDKSDKSNSFRKLQTCLDFEEIPHRSCFILKTHPLKGIYWLDIV